VERARHGLDAGEADRGQTRDCPPREKTSPDHVVFTIMIGLDEASVDG
jgi:hypothetical protein